MTGTFTVTACVADWLTGPRITTAPTTVDGGGDGSGNGTGGGDGGNGTATTVDPRAGDGGGLSTGAIIGLVVGLVVLLLLLLLLCLWLFGRRRRDDGRPYSIAFYQAVRAGRPPPKMAGGCGRRGDKCNPPWLMGGYRPRSIDHQVYGRYCGPANCFVPRYNQHSIPMSPIYY